MTLSEQIPGLSQAIEREQFVRDSAFLDMPERVAGFDVKPFTLRHVLLLSLVGNPFMVGGAATPVDVGQFLWAISTEWSPSSKWRRRWFFRRCRRINYVNALKEIESYLAESFQDAPGGGAEGERQSFYSFAASMVDLFGKEYGWTERETINLPLKRLFQLMAVIRKRNNPDAVMFNPSDKVRGDWLKAVNGN